MSGVDLPAGGRYTHPRPTSGYGASERERSVLGSAVAAGQIAAAGVMVTATLPASPASAATGRSGAASCAAIAMGSAPPRQP